MSADENRLTAGRGWNRLVRALGRSTPTKLAEANRIARKTRALTGRRKGK